MFQKKIDFWEWCRLIGFVFKNKHFFIFFMFRDDFKQIDTAYMYSDGESETILGSMDSWKERYLRHFEISWNSTILKSCR